MSLRLRDGRALTKWQAIKTVRPQTIQQTEASLHCVNCSQHVSRGGGVNDDISGFLPGSITHFLVRPSCLSGNEEFGVASRSVINHSRFQSLTVLDRTAQAFPPIPMLIRMQACQLSFLLALNAKVDRVCIRMSGYFFEKDKFARSRAVMFINLKSLQLLRKCRSL